MAIVKETGEVFKGRVLRTYSQDYRAMSDVYTLATFAEVWNDETKRIEILMVNANFECDMSGNYAVVDATPVTRLRARIFVTQQKIQNNKIEAMQRAAREKTTARVGKVMRVVKGRKVKQGTTGIVAFLYTGDWGVKALLKDPDSDWRNRNTPGVWVAANNLEEV